MLPFVLVFILIGVVLIALVVQKRLPRLRGVAGGLLISYIFIALALLGGELYFRYAFAESENTVTLATINWLDRNWQTNQFGYRDREWSDNDYTKETTVAVVGDSFTAGWGIDDPQDRFSDVLAHHLGDDYAVFNLGIYGTNTPEQLENLRGFTENATTPDIVILQYFLNDINYAMLSVGALPEAAPAPAWANESYLANFLYNRLIGRLIDSDYNRDWWAENYAAYDNAAIWNIHVEEINAFIDYIESIDARLIVVIFPNMLDPVRSVAYVDRVAQVFESRGHADILKLFDAAAAWSPAERMVSPRDTHPSAAFHQYVGDTLYEQFFSGGAS